MLIKINPSEFTPFLWRGCSPHEIFGIQWRTSHIYKHKISIKSKVIGYCDAEQLVCRPKKNHKAVMFLHKGEVSWCHLRNKEFKFVEKSIDI